MAAQGNYALQDALNRCLPVAKRAGLGDLLNSLINGVNGLAARMDAAGGQTVNATATNTVTGTIHAGDTYTIKVINPKIAALASPGLTMGPGLVGAGDTLVTIAAEIAALVNGNPLMIAEGISATASSSVVTTAQAGTIGNASTFSAALSAGASVVLTWASSGVAAGGTGEFGTDHVAKFAVPTLASKA
jgi:hypothetical protein